MATMTLVVAGVVSLIAGASFLLVARGVVRREATGDRLLARRAHAAWWAGLGSYLLLQGALTLGASVSALTTGVYLGSRVVAIPLLCVATWGIAFYLAYLYTGRPRLARPLGILYAAVGALFLYATFSVPQALVVERWIIGLDDSGALYRLVYALVGLPPIVASVGYLALLRRVRDAAQRYRILLIGGSILLYIGSGLAARLSGNDALAFATLVLLGLAAAGASVLAYYPPARIRRRLEGSA